MILIISQDTNEDSTNYVIDWLYLHRANFIRLNGSEFEYKAKVTLSISNQEECKVDIDGCDLIDNEINVVWYRRWTDKDFFYSVDFGDKSDSKFDHDVSSHLFN